MNLCKLFGPHKWVPDHTFVPSITAEVVTEYKFFRTCLRCGETRIDAHEKWNFEAQEFEPVETEEQ